MPRRYLDDVALECFYVDLDLLISGHVLVIQKLPSGDPKSPKSYCAYRYCPSLHGECLPGTYRICVEPGVLSDHKWNLIPIEASAPVDVEVETTEKSKGHSQGVRTYCLKCFEKIWRCAEDEIATNKVLSLPEYKHIAQLENRIHFEDRSYLNPSQPSVDVGKAHQNAYKQWLSAHTSREVGMSQAEDLDAFLASPYVKIFKQLCAIPAIVGGHAEAGITADNAWGKNLSEVFAEVDEFPEARDEKQRLALQKEKIHEHEELTEKAKGK
ncbi:MAG: hypothetical protein Q9199_004323 [Rusavskia elegans]